MQDPAPNWSDMVAKGWSPPYVALIDVMLEHSPSERQFGAGLLLDEWHVLTCLHVLYIGHPKEEEGNPFHRDSKSQALPDFYEQRAVPKIMVRLFHANARSVEAKFVAQHSNHDLAIVKLERAASGLAPPLEPGADPIGKVFICGFMMENHTYVAAQEQVKIEPDRKLFINGKQVVLNYHFGAQGGFSGAPVLSCKDGEVPRFLGLAVLGGDGTPTGQILAAEGIWPFLSQHRVGGSSRGHVETGAATILGYRQTIRPPPLPDGPPLPGFDCLVPDDIHAPAIFVSRTPISASAANAALGKPVRAGGIRLPAHLEHRDDVDALLDKLRQKTRLPLRLLLPGEWNRFRREHFAAGESIRPTGRPAFLSDFEADETLRPPPANIREWLQGTGGPGLYKSDHDGPVRPVGTGIGKPLSQSSDQERHVVRLAFTAGELA